MKVLVTGGSGFIGTHLVRALVGAGHSVTSLDLRNPQTAFPKQARFIQGDVRDRDLIRSVLPETDAIFHFAGIVSVPLCEERIEEGESTNFGSTVTLLEEIAARSGLEASPIRIFFSSSASVYGKSSNSPLSEEMVAPTPSSRYADQKLRSELAIRSYSPSRGIPALVFRFFNVYGPGQDPHSPYSGVLSIFSERLRNRQPLTLFGDGSQTRDFISVHDIVSACLKALALPTAALDGRAINLATGKSRSLLEVIQIMGTVLSLKVELQHAPPRVGDIQFSEANNQLAKALLNWIPAIDLEKGLDELLLSGRG